MHYAKVITKQAYTVQSLFFFGAEDAGQLVVVHGARWQKQAPKCSRRLVGLL